MPLIITRAQLSNIALVRPPIHRRVQRRPVRRASERESEREKERERERGGGGGREREREQRQQREKGKRTASKRRERERETRGLRVRNKTLEGEEQDPGGHMETCRRGDLGTCRRRSPCPHLQESCRFCLALAGLCGTYSGLPLARVR
jgi:hypothetical protein